LRQRQVGLQGVFVGLAHDAAGELVDARGGERRADDRFVAPAGEGVLHHAVLEHGQRIGQDGRFATPPGGQRGHGQWLTQQVLGNGREKTQHRAGFKWRRAWCVGQQQVARPHRLHQPGHAQGGVGPQLQRVEPLVVQPFDEHVHRLQPMQGFEVQALVAHGEVVAFDQVQAQVARQVGVFKVRFVVGAGGEQGDACFVAFGAQPHQALHQRLVAGRQALYPHVGKRLGELARNGDAVFQQVTQAGRCLRAVRDHPPAPVGPAGQVEGGDVQPGVARWAHAVHGAQVAGVALHQGGGQQGLVKQGAWAVDVGHDGVQQAGALQHAGFDLRPVFGRNDHGEQVEGPGALLAVLVGVHVVGDAVVAQLLGEALLAAVQVAKTVESQVFEELGPMRRQTMLIGGTVAQFVQVAGAGARSQRRGQRAGTGSFGV